jgi:hypothetical protein
MDKLTGTVGPGDRKAVIPVPAQEQRSGRYEGSGVVGMAERYWKELRPSRAGRFRLEASIRPAREDTERDLRRPRPHARPKLRTTSR